MKQLFFFIAQFLLLLFGLAFIVYTISVILPGNAEEILAGMEHTSIQTDDTTFSTYIYSFFSWVWALLHLQLGTSVYLDIPIVDLIVSHWSITLLLNGLSWIIALFFSLSIVKILFQYQHIHFIKKIYTVLETVLLSFTPLTLSLLIIMCVTFFSIPIPLFYTSNGASLESVIRYIVPLIVLVLLQIPLYVRSLLKAVTMISKLPFVHFSYSLGYSQSQIWKNDILPNALLYTIAISSVQISVLMGGSILIEFTFAIPGLGTLLVNAVNSRDLLLMRTIVLVYGVIIGTVHIILKLLYKHYYTTISYGDTL